MKKHKHRIGRKQAMGLDIHAKILRKFIMDLSGLNMQSLLHPLILQNYDPYCPVKQ